MGNGAIVWDLQIPYHHGFRITVQSTGDNIYFGVEWRPVADDRALSWFHMAPVYSDQARAESRLHSAQSPWHDPTALLLDRTDTLRGHDTLAVADLTGPAMLQMLRFIPSMYDYALVDSTWLNIYWDDCPTPSVHVPLLDFYLSPNGVTKIRALQMRVDQDSGLISYLPMPFYHHARIELVRDGTTPLQIRSMVQYNRESVERNLYGYFHADFSESNPTRFHVYHPVLNLKGRGRYMGYGFGVMERPHPAVYLEGDPIFTIDSSPINNLRYTCGEDYFNAGWWFANGMFTLPFAGFTHFIDAFYRFHYLDCYDFNRSFQFDLQPGGNADIYDHFRTVGYYYLHWTPFWTNRDTIRAGQEWTIAGAAYKPGEAIQIRFGDNSLATIADANGEFSLSVTVPSFWKPGNYALTVNGESSPKSYCVLHGPSIRIVHDTLPVTVVYRDSLVVSGTGYEVGEHVQFYLDSIALDQEAVADSTYGFRTVIRIPYLAEYPYLLVARGERSGFATAADAIHVTRTLYLQCEDMMPPVVQSPGECYVENVSYFWMASWGKQTFVYFKPDTASRGGSLQLAFQIPHADTFRVEFHNSVGKDLGHYRMLIDSIPVAEFNGYKINSPEWWDPLPSGPIACGTHYLGEGEHRLTFVCLGTSDSARNAWVQPDFIVLTPVTDYPFSPGTLDSPAQHVLDAAASLHVYPNPIHSNSDRRALLRLDITGNADAAMRTHAIVTIFDATGRIKAAYDAGPVSGGYLLGELPKLPRGSYFIRVELQTARGATQFLPVQNLSVE
jgi:hypothetical protein